MVLVVVGVLQKEPVHRARRVGTGERLPCRKVLEVLLVHVAGKREKVREVLRPDVRRQTNVPQAEQTLGPRTLQMSGSVSRKPGLISETSPDSSDWP